MFSNFSLLYEAWIKIDRLKQKQSQSHNQSEKIKQGSFNTLQGFVSDWFQWNNPKKSLLLFETTSFFFISYTIFATRLYIMVCVVAYIYFLILPLIREKVFLNIVNGFWYST